MFVKKYKEMISDPNYRNWFMGLDCPNLYDGIPDDCKWFSSCFRGWKGGECSTWIVDKVMALSDEDKVKIIQQLLPKQDDTLLERGYLGLLPDGSINKLIPPFPVDENTDVENMESFWGNMTPEQCAQRRWPHNERSRNYKEKTFYCYCCKQIYPLPE